MKRSIVLVLLPLVTSCARKTELRAPELIRADHYLYTKGDDGRVYIVTTNTKDFDQAMKELRPGRASVNKLDLWVVSCFSSGSRLCVNEGSGNTVEDGLGPIGQQPFPVFSFVSGVPITWMFLGYKQK